MSHALLLLGLLSLAGAQVQVPQSIPPPPAEGMVRVSFTIEPDGPLEIWDIEQSRYDALPVWSPAAGPVPLTFSDAVKAAEAVLTPQHPGVRTWFPTNTALLRDAGGRAWAYRLTLGVGTYAPGTPVGRFSVLVLLDGSVIEPKRFQGTPITQNVLPRQPVQAPTGVYRAGAGVVVPQVLESPKPKYTAAAMRARIEGQVRMSCVVNTDGQCEDIKILQSLDRDNGLDDEAVNTLRQWRFAPGTLNGVAVKVQVIVELQFNLRDRK